MREDVSGSVSAQVVAQVSGVEQRPVATERAVGHRALLQARRRFVGDLSDNGRHSRALHCARALECRRAERQRGRVGTRGRVLALEL